MCAGAPRQGRVGGRGRVPAVRAADQPPASPGADGGVSLAPAAALPPALAGPPPPLPPRHQGGRPRPRPRPRPLRDARQVQPGALLWLLLQQQLRHAGLAGEEDEER